MSEDTELHGHLTETQADRRKLAQDKAGASPLMTLAHHIDVKLATRGMAPHHGRTGRRESTEWTRKSTGSSWRPTSCRSSNRAKSGAFTRAPPVRPRAHPEGRWRWRTRAIGIPNLRGQGAAARGRDDAPEAVYEQSFYDFSYGFQAGSLPRTKHSRSSGLRR